jgi:hypothetical protein
MHKFEKKQNCVGPVSKNKTHVGQQQVEQVPQLAQLVPSKHVYALIL